MWGPKAKQRSSGALSAGLKDGRMKGGRTGISINPRHRTLICNLTPVVDRTFKWMHKERCSNDGKSPTTSGSRVTCVRSFLEASYASPHLAQG